MSNNISFILGGVRCGKSAYSEKIAMESDCRKIYVATCEALDGELRERIKTHKARRGDDWQLIEEAINIVDIIKNSANSDAVILVDCLTLWLSNLLHYNFDIEEYIADLCNALREAKAKVILVSNEVGQGITPNNALARKFIDYAGILHQKIAKEADKVVFMIAGIPTIIKGE